MPTRREMNAGLFGLAAAALPGVPAAQGPQAGDRVFVTNEDSCTLSVIDPVRDAVIGSVNLTSFDEDPRPPFRFVTGGVMPTHEAMLHKPLYRGAVSIHGAAPSPDGRLLAVTGRGSSNVYLIDTVRLEPVGASANPVQGDVTPTRLPGGVLVGREPHEPTFSPNGRELWVAVRGENFISVHDVERMKAELAGVAPGGHSLLKRIPVMSGPSMVWFTADGSAAMVASQKRSEGVRISLHWTEGRSSVRQMRAFDLRAADPFGFTPFLKLSPDGDEMWLSHKLADRISIVDPRTAAVRETIALSTRARPNHVEFVENANGRAVYASQARVDDHPEGATSQLAVIDREARRIVAEIPTGGREAHGLWCDPDAAKLYVAHELDALPGQPLAGEAVVSVFDVRRPFEPRRLAVLPLGALTLPSGALRHKKSINLVYVRPSGLAA